MLFIGRAIKTAEVERLRRKLLKLDKLIIDVDAYERTDHLDPLEKYSLARKREKMLKCRVDLYRKLMMEKDCSAHETIPSRIVSLRMEPPTRHVNCRGLLKPWRILNECA